ncbi:zinc finger protein 436-like [Anolis sagrei]|uniref:zinc finger protein 436-like n=1 Tax=Anolis sagrei TaxID=38937 RepID=UPI003522C124
MESPDSLPEDGGAPECGDGAPGGPWARQQRLFREFCQGAAQGPRETCLRIRALCQEWLQPQRRSRRRMLDLVVLEQFLKALPPEVEQRIRSLGPRSSTQAAALAEGLLHRRRKMQGSPAELETEDMPSANGEDPPEHQGILQEGERDVGSPGNEVFNGDVQGSSEDPLRPPPSLPNTMEVDPIVSNEIQKDPREDPANLGDSASSQRDPWVPLDLHVETVSPGEIPSPAEKEALGTDVSNEDEESADIGSDEEENGTGDGMESNKKNKGLKRKADEAQQTHRSKWCVVENHLLEPSGGGGSQDEPESCTDDDADLLLVCSECGKCFARQADLAKHERTHIGGEEDPKQFTRSSEQGLPMSGYPNGCAIGGNAFEKGKRLVRHQRKHEKRPCRCLECKKAFGDAETLQAHQRMYRNMNAERRGSCSQLFSLFAFQNMFLGEKTYKCTECGKRFKSRTHLQAHHRIHTSERPSELRSSTPVSEKTREGLQSGKIFSPLTNLQSRFKVLAEEKRYGCSECPESFACREQSQSHERNHAGEKAYQCPDCGKSFARISHLKAHQVTHTGEKPHKCSDCGEIFVQDSLLKAHQRTHMGEKPYKCLGCGKSFSRSSEWKEHQLIHTKEKPYKCLINNCGKGFCGVKSLKKHQRNFHRQSTGPKE